MRFQCLALLAALAASSTEAAKTLNAKELNDMLRSGKVDTKALLKGAVPYKIHLRNLEDGDGDGDGADMDGDGDGDGDQDGEGEQQDEAYNGYLQGEGITGDMSISFNKCVALSVQQEMDGDVVDSAEDYLMDGSIRSMQSYVLFNVCTTGSDCVYGDDSEENTYLVDLNTWIASTVIYLPDKKEEFCTGCQMQQSYCESQASYAARNMNYETAYYMYNDVKYQLIDCTQCYALSCYDENDDYDENDWEGVSEWIEELSECTATGVQWHDMDLYAGWMCNAAGTGIEIAVFVDEECSIYNSNKSYQRLLEDGSEVWEYYAKSTEVMSYLFTNRFDCYGGDITYVNLMQQVYLEEGEYDPCQYDNTTSMVLDYDECYEMLNEIPCYNGEYDDDQDQDGDEDGQNGDGDGQERFRRRYRRWLEDGNQDGDGDQDEQCEEFMSYYPCWTMPGEQLSEDYQDACDEYLAEFKPEANEACAGIFENGDAEVTALSDCMYGQDQADEEEDDCEGEQEQEDGDDWAATLLYDIYEDDAEDEAVICSYIDQIYNGEIEAVTPGYNHETSGTMYGEDNNNQENGGYFPTVNSSSLRKPKNVGTAGIIMLSLFAVVCTFMVVSVLDRVRKAYRRKQIAAMKDSKDVPFLL
jgi:hypothetical protein